MGNVQIEHSGGMTHPGKPEHVMRSYRQYILDRKKKWSSARGLIHYRAIVDEYLAAKRAFLKAKGGRP